MGPGKGLDPNLGLERSGGRPVLESAVVAGVSPMAAPNSATVSSMDGPEGPVFGREPARSCSAVERASVEAELRASPATLNAVARALVESQFPLTIAPDVLSAVGLDPDVVSSTMPTVTVLAARKRDVNWRHQIVAASDRSCAFHGFDGALGGAPVGIEAAHIRWFNCEGPDDLDNGLALHSLHHKLLDRGAIGLREPETVIVSSAFSAVGAAGRAVYELHGRGLRPRPGTVLPAPEYVMWHHAGVFKGDPLTA